MREECQYKIVTFDVEGVVGAAALRERLALSLGLPDGSSISWEVLSDALPLLPREKFYFILYNGLWLDENDRALREALRAFIDKLVRASEGSAVLNDVFEERVSEERKDSLRSLFDRRPFQFGLRGDDHLWRELGEYLRKQPKPRDEADFTKQLVGAIETLAGQPVEAGKDFYVERYDSGGMSSGYINSDFWINVGIPLLIGRYRMAYTDSH